MTGCILEARGVYYSVDENEILENVDFSAGPGFTALIGPNGAGKTTLLRILSGFLRPRTGEAFLLDRPVLSYTPKERARHMAVVTQQARMEYAFTVEDVVLMGRTAFKKSFEADTKEDHELAKWALDRTGMLSFRHRLITCLSGGEQQRVMIARALCQTSRVLLLDEPVSALDLRHQTEILGTVREATQEQGLTCVCVLHDLNLAAHYADAVVLMDDGMIRFEGAPQKVLQQDILEEVYRTRIRILKDEEELYVLPDMRAKRT